MHFKGSLLQTGFCRALARTSIVRAYGLWDAILIERRLQNGAGLSVFRGASKKMHTRMMWCAALTLAV